MRRRIRYLLAGSAATCGVWLALSAGTEAVAAPYLASHFQTSSIASLTIGGATTPLQLLDGAFNFQDPAASCVVSPPAVPSCDTTLNFFWANFQDFTVTTTAGTFTVNAPTISVKGPITIHNTGSGFVLPTGTPVTVTGNVSGTFSNGTSVGFIPWMQASTSTSNVTMTLSVPNQTMSVSGTLPFSNSAFGHTVSGTISMMLAARSPFDHMPPVALPFDGGNTPSNWTYPDWAYGEYKAECSSPGPMFGLSAFGNAHSILCESPFSLGGGSDMPFNSTGMTTEIFSSSNSANYGHYGDWDYGYYKGDCPVNQFIVGVAQTPAGVMDHALCASGVVDGSGFEQVPTTTCRTLTFPGNNPTSLPDGDWALFYYKLECAYNEVVVGVSTNPSTHQPHGILCCSLVDSGGH